MGKFRKLVEINENLEPTQPIDEIFGKFPITCAKCMRELDRNEIIIHCDATDRKNLVWVTPLHIECAKKLHEERGDYIVTTVFAKEWGS